MADVVRYVDPDATGAGDGTSWTDAYTSMDAADSAEATEDADTHIFYVRSSGGTADTTKYTVSVQWNGTAVVIEAADGDEAVKTGWDASRYRLSVTDDSAISFANDPFDITLRNIQVESVHSSANWKTVIYDAANAASTLVVEGCRIRADGSGSGTFSAFSGSANTSYTIENTIVEGSFLNNGIQLGATSGHTVYHSVVYGAAANGLSLESGGTATVTNCAFFSCNDDVNNSGTLTISYCASDDGDGTNSVAASGTDWDNEFSDYANGDFTLLNSGNLYHGGTTISGGPSTDMDGDTWHASTPSIGVDEVTASATVSKSTRPAMFNSPVFGGILVS